MTDVLAFWGVAIVIGALALPLAFRFFGRFPDTGVGLAFTLGLTLVAAGYFFLRVIGAFSAGQGGFLLVIALFGLATCVIAARDRNFKETFSRSFSSIAVVSGLFSLLFFGFAVFWAHTSDIANTEQPMDFLYLNSMLVSPDYPPHDPWFSGENASYHYGGYLQAAVLTGASGVWPAAGYGLSLAALFASAGTAAFSLCSALTRWLWPRVSRSWVVFAAGLGVVLLLLSGSLASSFELASAHDADHQGVYTAFGVEGLVRCGSEADETCTGLRLGGSSTWYPDDHWVWWRMSRMAYWGPHPPPPETVFPTTVTETPSFSFILGDLHPHVMSIPGVLLAIGVCAALWRGRGRLCWQGHRRLPWYCIVIALIFGSLAFVNVWDVLVFSPLLAVVVFARNLRTQTTSGALWDAISWLTPPALLAVVAFSPWWLDFSPETGGVYAYSGEGTRIEHVLLMWGVLIVFSLTVLYWLLQRGDNAWSLSALFGNPRLPGAFRCRHEAVMRSFTQPFFVAFGVAVLPFAVWLIFVAFQRTAAPYHVGDGVITAFSTRTGGAWAALLLYGFALWFLAAATFLLDRRRHAAAPIAALAALGVLLLYLTELFLLRDALFFLPRFNTVFKLSYQAWIVLSIAGASSVVGAMRITVPRFRPYVVVPLVVLLGASLVFVITNVPNRAGGFNTTVSLDGLRYVQEADGAEYELIRWLQDNVEGDEIVVEASGRLWERGDDGMPVLRQGASSYNSSVSRVGYRTGLQTPIGWPGHEITWRGRSQELLDEITRRQDLVDLIYTAPSEAQVLAALQETGASYVVVGMLERSAYSGGLLPPFGEFLDTVFVEGNVSVFRVPISETVATR
ncbi:MAG: hypothetical protein CL897_06665 [Dehalococcoidia bacterium]|nr:hypothetical protein [Dehalococcoidia bacterium]HCU99808.1 hypothetical protein [Dehalococcoidia bacterium]